MRQCRAFSDASRIPGHRPWKGRLHVTVKADPDCKRPKDHDDDLEYCFPLAKSMNIRARNDVTFRQQLLENAALIAASALSDDIGKELCSELKNDTTGQDCILKL